MLHPNDLRGTRGPELKLHYHCLSITNKDIFKNILLFVLLLILIVVIYNQIKIC